MTSINTTAHFFDIQSNHPIMNTQGKPNAGAFTAYADGSSLGNPGPAGWAYVIIKPDGTRTHRAGQLEYTTNNRAELLAAIEVLLALPRGASGVVRLDSDYVVTGINDNRAKWMASGWKNANGQGVANHDLFAALYGLADALPRVRFEWIRGHDGDALNTLVDRLARSEAAKAQQGLN